MHVLPDTDLLVFFPPISNQSTLTVLLRCRTLNRLVMDYLVIEGYKTAAEEFSKEANLEPFVDLDSIQSRMDIRDAVQRGDIEEAIIRVNDLNPEVGLGFMLLSMVASSSGDYND